jgi:predicted HTH domain antitoxin
MSIRLALELPEDVLPVVRSTPDHLAYEIRLAAAVRWYELGLVSQEKAAEIAGISRVRFIESLARFKVSPFQVTADELAQDASRA